MRSSSGWALTTKDHRPSTSVKAAPSQQPQDKIFGVHWLTRYLICSPHLPLEGLLRLPDSIYPDDGFGHSSFVILCGRHPYDIRLPVHDVRRSQREYLRS